MLATLVSAPGQPVRLDGVSWATYTCLLADLGDSHAARLAYDQGKLEIMAPSFVHERLKSLLTDCIVAMLTGMDLDFESAGSTTFKREDLGRGFEPDASFYVQHVDAIRNHTMIDLTTDPPPDLVVEIDVTHPSLPKLPIYAALGVPEIWRHDGQQVVLYQLVRDHYEPTDTSAVCRGVHTDEIMQLLEQRQEMSRAAWIRQVQHWAQARRSGGTTSL